MGMNNPYIKLWNHKDDIVWHFPGRKNWTVDDIAASSTYARMLDEDVILVVDEEGKVFEWTYLKFWKDQYGVDTEDPEQALEDCLEARNVTPTTQKEIEEMLDVVAEATVENEIMMEMIQEQQLSDREQIEANAVAIEEIIMLVME